MISVVGKGRSRKLDRKEFEALIIKMQHLEPNIKKNIAPLVWHLRALEEEMRVLEAMVEKVTVQELFSSETPSPERKETPKERGEYLAKRLHEMWLDGKADTEEFARTLRWNKLTPGEAMLLIEREHQLRYTQKEGQSTNDRREEEIKD